MKEAMADDLKAVDVALIGICCDHNSSYLRGPAGAPGRIRTVLNSSAGNDTSESGVSLSAHPKFRDVGDRSIEPTDTGFMEIERHIEAIVTRAALPLVLGGDHAISYPILRAVAGHHGPVDILHIDAHTDLYEDLDGNRFSHGSPFARIMEEKLATRLMQVGIRTMTKHQRQQAERFGVEIHEMKDLDLAALDLEFERPVYLSFDMDALDPAFAPGVSHHEPGGLSVRDVLGLLRRLRARLIGADIVEYNPARDTNDRTAAVAAKLVKEFAAKMIGGEG